MEGEGTEVAEEGEGVGRESAAEGGGVEVNADDMEIAAAVVGGGGAAFDASPLAVVVRLDESVEEAVVKVGF